MKKYLFGVLGALLACGAPSDADEDADDLGQVEEPLQAECASPNQYGVDLSTWGDRACNVNSGSAACALPSTVSGPLVSLRNGWSSSERALLGAYGNAAKAVFHNTFPSWEPSGHLFRWSNTGSGDVSLDKGAIAGSASPLFENYVHMACLNSSPLSESFAMASAQRCVSWGATIDYAKVLANVPADNRGAFMFNLFEKIYAISIGLGTYGVAANLLTAQSISDFQAGDWATPSQLGGVRQDSWAKNYSLISEGTSTLHCYL